MVENANQNKNRKKISVNKLLKTSKQPFIKTILEHKLASMIKIKRLINS